MSWWRRRDPARDEHASSRVDLIALWGPDDEPIGDDAPGLDEDVVPDEERAVDDNVAVDDEVMLNDESALDDVAAVDDEPATAAPDDPLGTIDAPDDALGTIDAPDYAVESVDAPDHAPAASARLGASDDLLDAPPAAAPSAFAPPVPPAPVRERPPGGGRAVRVLLIGAVIAGGLLVDQAIGHGSAPAAHAAAPPAPTMAPAGALSSTWLCPALGASAASPVLGSLVVGNPGGAPVTATATIVPASGAPVVQHVALAPYTKQVIALDAAAPGDYAAATVTFDGAAGAVEQRVHGPFGDSVAPCASATSDHWYFPTGETDAGATEYLSLYNPFPSAAIADLSFETDQGLAVPDAFQGVVVPANGFTVLDIGARVRSRTSVATIVSVRGGRVVADELQSLSAGARGLVLTLGAPAPGTSWFYANGGIGPGVRERFDVFNPGTHEASVTVAPILEQGSADPFTLSVPPQGEVSLEVDQQARIPPGVGEAWVLTAPDNAPVVAERVIASSRPATAAGTAATLGAPATAKRWVFVAGPAAKGGDERLVIANPGGADAHVTVVASGQGAALRLPPVVVPAAGRVSIDISRLDPGDVMLDVTAEAPVVAERALYGSGASNATGIAGS